MNIKKLLSVLLLAAFLLGLLPVTAMAQPTAVPIEGPRVETVLTPRTVDTPTLAPGNHQHYMDRVTSVPDYAWDYYHWLEENANANGVLADPTKATEDEGEYYHVVTHISRSEQFTYQSRDEMLATAREIAGAAMQKEFTSFSAYIGVVQDAFDREHPEVFWLSGRFSNSYVGSYSYTTQGNLCTLTYEADMLVWLKYDGFDIRDSKYLDPQTVAAAIRIRDAAVKEILADCPAGSDYERVAYLNDALTARNAYNSVIASGGSANVDRDAWECISALVGCSGSAGPVCEGYARAFQVLCNELAIPCVLVNGNAKSELGDQAGGHMWNYVQIDGGWYAVDVTWNDPYVSSCLEQKKSGYECKTWLLLGSDTQVSAGLSFLASHEVTNRNRTNGLSYTNGPVLERQAYDPTAPVRYSISGTVTSVGNEAVTVQLWQGSTLKATQTISGSSAAYRFDGLQPGSYQVTAIKAGHVSRSQTLTLSNSVLSCSLKLCLLGDVNGDGKINVGDVARVYGHIRKTSAITDPYALLCADVSGDGRLNVGDTARIYSMIRG